MSKSVIDHKSALRDEMLERRDKMPKLQKRKSDQLICEELFTMALERNVKVIHTYLPMKSEVNVIPLIKVAMAAGITIVAPKTLRKRQLENLILTDLNFLEKGVFGTYHPRNAEIYKGHYDMIIVAGLAFSDNLYRVGYGGGYYDTFLADQKNAHKVGVGYPFQMVQTVPTENHDVPLDEVISY